MCRAFSFRSALTTLLSGLVLPALLLAALAGLVLSALLLATLLLVLVIWVGLLIDFFLRC